MKKYLESTEYIDWETLEVLAQAKALVEGLSEPEEVAQKCFEYVRDEIKHSWDYKLNPVTCKASDVLKHGTLLLCKKPFTSGTPSHKRYSNGNVLPTPNNY